VAAVLGWLASLDPLPDGVTVSGGEPFQQPRALRELLEGIGRWRPPRLDILLYSGYTYSHLSRRPGSREILELCDAVVAGPYVQRRNDGAPLRGSSNQRLVPLTVLGRERYGTVNDTGAPRVQISVTDGPEGRRVYYIGIPGRGDMDQLNTALERAGVRAGDVSWRP
jgi:anaerobic ribonucleoside-triphosphate reductase activating protein